MLLILGRHQRKYYMFIFPIKFLINCQQHMFLILINTTTLWYHPLNYIQSPKKSIMKMIIGLTNNFFLNSKRFVLQSFFFVCISYHEISSSPLLLQIIDTRKSDDRERLNDNCCLLTFLNFFSTNTLPVRNERHLIEMKKKIPVQTQYDSCLYYSRKIGQIDTCIFLYF